MFDINVGSTDRIVRIIAGVIGLALFFIYPETGWRWLFGLVGIVLLATGVFSRCLLYSLFGISTGPKKVT